MVPFLRDQFQQSRSGRAERSSCYSSMRSAPITATPRASDDRHMNVWPNAPRSGRAPQNVDRRRTEAAPRLDRAERERRTRGLEVHAEAAQRALSAVSGQAGPWLGKPRLGKPRVRDIPVAGSQTTAMFHRDGRSPRPQRPCSIDSRPATWTGIDRIVPCRRGRRRDVRSWWSRPCVGFESVWAVRRPS